MAHHRGGHRTTGRTGTGPLRTVLLALLAFVALQAVFFGLIVGAAAVPDRPIVQHLAKDVKAHVYGPTGIADRMGGRADSFTECVVAGTGIGMPTANPVRKAALMPRLSGCADGADQIRQLNAGKPLDLGAYYFRYWAGYTPLTRPALALFGLTGLRIIVGGIFVASTFAAATALRRGLGGWAATGLLAPLFLASNLLSTPSSSFSQTLSMSVALFSVWLVVTAARRSLRWGLGAVALSAALYCYVDLLTTPEISWAFSAAALTAVTYVKRRSIGATLRALVAAGLLWPIAFALTWATRWLIAVPFAGVRTVWDNVVYEILFRTQGEYRTVTPGFGQAILRNLKYWNAHMTTAKAVVVVAAVLIVIGLVIALRGSARNLLATVLIGVPAIVVPLWYEALSNHSQIHAFFVYKAVPAALGVLLFAVAVGARTGKLERAERAERTAGGEDGGINANPPYESTSVATAPVTQPTT